MNVKQALLNIKEKTGLTDQEYAELEELFGKFFIAHLVEQLDSIFSPEQKQQMVDKVEEVMKSNQGVAGLEQINLLFQAFGIQTEKVNEMTGIAQDFAFNKIAESLKQA